MTLWTRRNANAILIVAAVGLALTIAVNAYVRLTTPLSITLVAINVLLLGAGIAWHIAHPVRRNHP